mmetsp:Transcript_16423/g.34365  ORF Transcript_16423/g.34365 Transcript_16423/m.34365 type:complete len:389 (-) Transcript_16423:100-1266(-)
MIITRSSLFLLQTAPLFLPCASSINSDETLPSPRLLRRSAVDTNQAKLEKSTKQILEELFFPVPFYCDSNISPSGYTVFCRSLHNICREGDCGMVDLEASFNSFLQMETEDVCISHSSKYCDELDGRQTCYEIDFNSNETDSCFVQIDNTTCNSCEICGYLEGTDSWINYIVPDCSNVDEFETKSYQCEEVRTVDDMVDVLLQCPANNSSGYEDVDDSLFEDAEVCIDHCNSFRWSYYEKRKCINSCKRDYPPTNFTEEDHITEEGEGQSENGSLQSCMSYCEREYWFHDELEDCYDNCEAVYESLENDDLDELNQTGEEEFSNEEAEACIRRCKMRRWAPHKVRECIRDCESRYEEIQRRKRKSSKVRKRGRQKNPRSWSNTRENST